MPEDSVELRTFFMERARERDKASKNDVGEPGRAPTRPDRGPRTTSKIKAKPYTVRYLTTEEVAARKREAEASATGEHKPAEDRVGAQYAREGKTGTPEAGNRADAKGIRKVPEEPTPDEPVRQPGQMAQDRHRPRRGPEQDAPIQTILSNETGPEQVPIKVRQAQPIKGRRTAKP